jgi:indolepyruvate ferredoxin oxidoreductase beta subunit
LAEDIRNILMVGVGGQGIIVASDILTLAAMYTGYDAKKSEIHGMSQRGGSVFSHIRYGRKVHSPLISEGSADILFALEEMEALRWIGYAGRGSAIISLMTRIKPSGVEVYPEGIEEELGRAGGDVRFLDAEKLRDKLGSVKFMNVALLGVLSGHVNLPQESWKRAIEDRVPGGFFDANWQAFQTGAAYR